MKRIIAEFVPQAWINDNAVTVDPQGETEWDVTDTITSMGKEAALALEDDNYDTDELRDHPNAPAWVQHWSGPFYVRVEDSIREYYEGQ